MKLSGNGTPPLYDVPPFEINNENYFFIFIVLICITSANFQSSQLKVRLKICGSQVRTSYRLYF